MTKKRPTTNERTLAAVERFGCAVGGRDSVEVQAATGDLLEALANATQRQVTRAVQLLMERQDAERERLDEMERRMETNLRRLEIHQRHFEQVDLVLDEQARERAAGG